MHLFYRYLFAGAFCFCASFSLIAQDAGMQDELGASDEVLARAGDVTLTQGEIDAAFNRIPARHQANFIRDGSRVDQLISGLMRTKALAAAAREAGFDEEPLANRRMALAAEKELSEAWLEQVVADAPEADFELLAKEYYLAHPEEFVSSVTLDVSHILVGKSNRSMEDALALVTSLREQVLEDPSRFQDFIRDHSEDPSAANNNGRFPAMRKGQMVKEFEKAAFALENPGDLSEPVATTYGYHLIRLNGKGGGEQLPFEAVKEKLMKNRRETYLSEYRARYVKQQTAEKIVITDGAVEAMAKRYFGENLENAPRIIEE
jgi:peptidyl-prolyl cis-trans isomerase C